MAQYGRRVRHPRMSPEMRRRLELERHKVPTASTEGEEDESGSEVDQSWNLVDIARRQAPSSSGNAITTVVATVVTIVVDSGSQTLGEFTVATLPATVSNPSLGYFTIPSESGAPVIVSSFPARADSGYLSPAYSSPSSVTPTSAHDSPRLTVSDHFFSHISSSSSAIPSPSPSSSVSTPISSPSPSASSSTSTPVSSSSNSNLSSGSTSSNSVFSSDVNSSSSQSTFISTTISSSASAGTSGTAGVGAGAGGSTSTSESGSGGQTSSTNGSQSQSSGSSVNTSSVVGGVVGGVAGAVILFLLVLFLLRWRKYYARKTRGALPSGDGARSTAGPGSGPENPEMMSQRSSLTPLAAAAASTGFFSRWRQSAQTVSTQETTPSERGFQKISGRKIPSVLQSGGDGYGSDGEEEIVPGAAGSSTDLSPRVGHFAAAAPTIVETSAEGDEAVGPSGRYETLLSATTTRASDTDRVEGIFIRPSPARSPVASSVNLPATCQSTPPLQATRASSIPRRPDLIGRSHPSFDGSRGSRFTESID